MIKKITNSFNASQLLTDSAWSLIGNFLGKGFALIGGIWMARLLGKNSYGDFGLIKTTMLTLSTFSAFGFEYSATTFIARIKITNSKLISSINNFILKFTLIIGVLIAFFLILFSKTLAANWLGDENSTFSIIILAISTIFSAIGTVQVGLLAANGVFKNLARVNIVNGIFNFIIVAILTYKYGYNGALISLLLTQIFNCFLNQFFIDTPYMISFRREFQIDSEVMKDMVKSSVPLALQESLYYVFAWVQSMLLIRLSSAGDLGMYNAIMQWNAIVLFIPGILRNVILTHLSNSNKSKSALDEILLKTVIGSLLSIVVPLIVVFLMADSIALSYGHTFIGMQHLLKIVVMSAIFTSISNVFAQAYTAIGRNWLMLKLRIVRDLLTIVLFLIFRLFRNLAGAESLVYATLLMQIIFMILIIYWYFKAQKVS